nr:uncharacterized protein LOC100135433 precursor [Danio rerio]CAP71900.1 unnamed protein product [Danio rerio]
MSVRMAALLTLVFLLMIHRVYGQSGFGVRYGSTHICALQGSTVTMSCTFSYPYRSSVETAFWTKTQIREENEEFPDLSMDPEYNQRLQYLLNNQWNFNLRLSHVTKKDEREYYCRFTTEIAANTWIGIPGVRLNVTDLQLESPERVTEGDSVRLTCRSSCKLTDTPTFIWYRNSQPVARSILNVYSVSQVRRGHAGNYNCGVEGNKYTSPAVYLNVRYAPDTPVIFISGSAVIISGDSVTLNCSSDSNPPAEINWFKGTTSVGSGRIFSISKISSADSGEYKCRATNDHGVKYSDPVTLDVKYPPRGVSVSINGSAVTESRDSVSLMCISDSNPPALSFSWFEENQSSAVGSGQSFSAVQSGRFYCEAHNPHGAQRSDAVTVTVHQGASITVVAAASGGLFIIIIIIVILLCIIRMKRMSRRSAVNEYEKVDLSANTYAGLDPQSRSSDVYNTLTTVHPSNAVHQTSSSEYENLTANGRSAVDLHQSTETKRD